MTLLDRDRANIWHPYTQALTALPLIPIRSAKGTLLLDTDGRAYIDAISSWWVNLHGHSHPYINQKIQEQLQDFEQVIFAGFTYEPAVVLAERLLALLPGQGKAFFSDNGSTAVEVALKMAWQYWKNHGVDRKKILALEGSYHGDTFGAMALSERGIFTRSFEELLFEVEFIQLPSEDSLPEITSFLKKEGQQIAAFIYEPLLQGSAGMNVYEAKHLEQVIDCCKKQGILCIADEVMTGFGRTGELFASDRLSIRPDILCFSKGLTGGYLPMGLTTCSDTIYEAFLSTDKTKTLFHGHSYTGNALSCAAALASLDLLLAEECTQQRLRIEQAHQNFAASLQAYAVVKNVRVLGTVLAFDIVTAEADSYLNSIRDQVYQQALAQGVLLRPLGNVVYILPPYCITTEQLNKVYATIQSIVEGIA